MVSKKRYIAVIGSHASNLHLLGPKAKVSKSFALKSRSNLTLNLFGIAELAAGDAIDAAWLRELLRVVDLEFLSEQWEGSTEQLNCESFSSLHQYRLAFLCADLSPHCVYRAGSWRCNRQR